MLHAEPGLTQEESSEGTPCPQHSQDKVLGAERKGERGPGSRRTQGWAPAPLLLWGSALPTTVGYGSLPERHMHPVHGPNLCQDIWGFSEHQEAWMGREARDLVTRERGPMTALPSNLGLQDPGLLSESHLCGVCLQATMYLCPHRPSSNRAKGLARELGTLGYRTDDTKVKARHRKSL